VTETTVNDIRAYQNAIIKQGSYYDGEVQGLVTKDGRWKPIDFQPVKPLPPVADKAAYDAAIARNTDMFGLEIDQFDRIAKKNVAGMPTPTQRQVVQRESVDRTPSRPPAEVTSSAAAHLDADGLPDDERFRGRMVRGRWRRGGGVVEVGS
jgi:hypothetical protein